MSSKCVVKNSSGAVVWGPEAWCYAEHYLSVHPNEGYSIAEVPEASSEPKPRFDVFENLRLFSTT